MIEVESDQSVICQHTYPLFQVFTGKSPFSGMEASVAMAIMANGARPGRPNRSDFAASLWLLTQRCWSQKPQDRPDVREVIEVLRGLSAFIPPFER